MTNRHADAMADAIAALADATSALRRETARLRAESEVRSALFPETPAMTYLERILTDIEKSNREVARHLRTIVITFVSLAAITAFTAGVFVEAETGIISAAVPPPLPDEARLLIETPQDAQGQWQDAAEPRSEAARLHAAEEHPPDPASVAPDDLVPSPPSYSVLPGYGHFSLPAALDPTPSPAHLATLESRMTATLHRALWWQAAGIVAAIAALAGIAMGLARLRDWLFPLPKRPDVP